MARNKKRKLKKSRLRRKEKELVIARLKKWGSKLRLVIG